MNEEKYKEMMVKAADFVIQELNSEDKKSPEMVTAIAELMGKLTVNANL